MDQKTRTEKTTSVTTECKDGKTITKTVVTETTYKPDGSKSVSTSTHTSTKEGVCASSGSTAVQPDDSKAAVPSQDMSDFIKEAVDLHNTYRKNHKVDELKHNAELSKQAQTWADHLASIGNLAHSKASYKSRELGENIASKWSSVGADYTGQQVTDQWYSENTKFDFTSPDFKQGTGHFSQIVWKGSSEVGFGKSHDKEGRVYVVANYFPPGNVNGQFPANVFKAE